MRKSNLALLVAAAFAVTVMSAAVYARDSDDPSGSMTRGGMMSGGMMGREMMGSMSRMMGHCGDMMRRGDGSGRPNDQWRNAPDRQN